MTDKFIYDYYRYFGKRWVLFGAVNFFINPGLWFLFIFRKRQKKCFYLTNRLLDFILLKINKKYGIEISWRTDIGKGLYLGHARNITINPGAKLGENINIHKGVTIGQENRGKRKGVPTIGNSVWIGINATIVGNITIGDDVLIAPNSYVNMDVPSHSIVMGNPGKIISRKNATEDYINRIV